jgi:hypothetical protein
MNALPDVDNFVLRLLYFRSYYSGFGLSFRLASGLEKHSWEHGWAG